MPHKYPSGHYLVSDFDHRDPGDTPFDVDTGLAIQALDELPNSIRQVLQDSDTHVDIRWVEGEGYRIVKTVQKRTSEASQGTEKITIVDQYGKRTTIDPEILDERLGLKESPEELFRQKDIEFVSIDEEFPIPMDKWDLIMTEAGAVKKTFERGHYIMDEYGFPIWVEGKETTEVDEEKCYSSRFFEYPEDKRIKNPRARKALEKILKKDLSCQDVATLLRNKRADKRPIVAAKLVKAAKTMKWKSPERKWIEVQAKGMIASYKESKQLYEAKGGDIPPAELKILWSIWSRKRMQLYGKVPLLAWDYHRKLRRKLNIMADKGEIQRNEIEPRLQAAIERHYGSCDLKNYWKDTKEIDNSIPEWLENLPPVTQESPEPEENWDGKDWLPHRIDIQNESQEDKEI